MINNIHFGGGGFGVLGYIGVLNYFEKCSTIRSNYNISGTSAGAVFAFLICIGYKSNELIEIFTPEFLKSILVINSIIDYERNGNLLDLNFFWKRMEHICESKNYDLCTLTFEQLYNKSNRILNITGTCILNSKGEGFNVKTFPRMTILKALEISTCLPFLLRPIEFNNTFYIDGALSDYIFFKDNDIIVANNISFDRDLSKTMSTDFIEYVSNLYDAIISIATTMRYKSNKSIIITSTGLFSSFTKNEFFQIILDGYEKTELHFKKNN